MSAPQVKPAAATPPRNFGWMAEYTDEHTLLAAARKVRDSGYTKTDAFTPFPVHGIDHALGIKPTVLPFIVLAMGLTGLGLAILMQIWMNAIDYPYIISGKPFASLPAFVPVTFEMTILFSAFTTFLGMWALNGLPRFSNPVFTNPRFDRVTNDRFFLHVDSRDKYFNRESVRELLAATKPESLEEVIEDSTPANIPNSIWLGLLVLGTAALIPVAVVLNRRSGASENPRWHVFFDMDFQPKKKAQQPTTIFADGRAARPQVKGTVARGQLEEIDPFYLGYDPTKQTSALTAPAGGYAGWTAAPSGPSPRPIRTRADDEAGEGGSGETPAADAPASEPAASEPAATEAPSAEQPTVETPAENSASPAGTDAPASEPGANEEPTTPAEAPAQQAATTPAQDPPPADAAMPTPEASPTSDTVPTPPPPTADGAATSPAPAAGPNLPWITEFPVELDRELLALGKTKFETYCSVCHGYGGDGDGLVHRRAVSLEQGDWLAPTSLHDKAVRAQAVGNIFYTISNGKGKMAGYKAAISPKERWAIVAYVRALQRSRNADIEDVPVDMRAKIEDVKKAN